MAEARAKKAKPKKEKVFWTSSWTELPQKVQKKS